ncbi:MULTISPECIES: cyclopropane-fatty-acyl-phospholipid synthase family protein [Thioclava]|uniref:Class I SAM-dependent methyltransferase n=1 Tax=Thioclava electrotropha TaxID=1549850 RepID=A0ABX6YWY2_9RHOB|nr:MULTISPECIES: cyclopropane-fatty-acyl-phospholipid synthase family protein [Thioclava]MAQ38537.1 class I SAM-dependent methyltransferase [Thioclava sp.]MPQ93007.1 class I SAM-dependent methyltransferase [Thioclava sp. JE_KL1]OOY05809.1 SAM-dependent methyltransferase [Thioclava sp. F28-4]OOY10000.1 SAM-dependent methyltransferase [Thioclava sp. F36-7]OOY19871.1 SAM-dependent methyltransferase [Thioclava sp. DLFJ5-1]
MRAWDSLLDRMLRHLIRRGTLELVYSDETLRRYGDGTGDPVRVTIENPDVTRRIVLRPDLGVGEGYMNGDYTIANDDLRGFLALAIRNQTGSGMPWFEKPREASRFFGRRFAQFNPVNKARTNVAHHYDLSGELYDLFLDEDRQYSCAYFERPDMTLEEAQEAKKHHIAKKLLIEPGMTVLDIGCGWGGMALTLARDFGANVVGVTLSTEQHALARKRVKEAGLEDKIDIRLTDYRDVTDKFDRIVSVGMFEHVGVPHYREYFSKVRELLKPGGVSLIHFIGRSGPGGATADFITKYIFPGGYCPAMSEASNAVEHEGLITTDLEVWRLHYAETLRHWCDRFEANIDKAVALYDERFCRMWRFYLVASEMAFRHGGQVVFQYQLAHEVGDVPLTRDYLYRDEDEQEHRLAAE